MRRHSTVVSNTQRLSTSPVKPIKEELIMSELDLQMGYSKGETPARNASAVEEISEPPATKKMKLRQIHTVARLPTELHLKYQTQMDRINEMEALLDLVTQPAGVKTLSEANSCNVLLTDLLTDFKKEHNYFELNWPAEFLDHPYFKDNVNQRAFKLGRTLQLELTKLKEKLTLAENSSEQSQHHSALPDLSFPKFRGEDTHWPAFRDLFTQLILNNDQLTDIEKLHYLRGCVEGLPAKLISSLPLVNTSLSTSWNLLTAQYENKRLLIQAQLDILMDLPTLTEKDAVALTQLCSRVTEAIQALKSLGVGPEMWDCLIVHIVSRHLDHDTRELWETSLESSTEYPRFSQLESFLVARARALERVESASSTEHKTKQTPSRKSKAHTSVTLPETTQRISLTSTQYLCDCCNAKHFIVTCPKFREMEVQKRWLLVKKQRLCFNCLGRHSAMFCKSTITCKKCAEHHHTMLHESMQPGFSQPQQSRSHHSTSSRTH